ncbi:MAG: VCBS repeat-containing protein [Fibrobacteres bacterium]|nr:VCBS repeat-containing protein [Fibrobacterota bacterium]
MRFFFAFLVAMLLALCLPRSGAAQEFRNIGVGITGVGTGSGPGSDDVNDAGISVGDFDHDGKPDVLVFGKSNPTSVYGFIHTVEVWRNNGGGKYSKFEDFHALGDSLASSAAWADLDHDGYFELAVWVHHHVTDPDGGYDSGCVRIYGYNPGTNRFEVKATPPNLVPPLLYSASPVFRFRDLDQDGIPEFFVSAQIRPARGDYTPDHAVTAVYKIGPGLSFTAMPGLQPVYNAVVAFGDFDQDGKTDLFLAGNDTNAVSVATVYRYTGSGFSRYASLAAGISVVSADWGDYDGDGLPDLVLSGGRIATTRLYNNTGSGFLLDTAALSGSLKADADLGVVSFGDINGDGYPDLVVSGANTDYPGQYFTKVLVNDDGFFDDLGVPLQPFSLATGSLADFDGDGNVDLMLSGTTNDAQGRRSLSTVFYRNIRGDFHEAPAIDSLPPGRPLWGDFDHDGRLDLLVCPTGDAANGASCKLYHNDGKTMVPQASALDGIKGDPELCDLDGDGWLDVLLAGKTFYTGGLRWFRGTSSGFAEATLNMDSSLVANIQHVRVADFDGDGKPDLAAWGIDASDAATNQHSWSSIFRNLGKGAFVPAPKGDLPGLTNGDMAWGDFDRDGKPDLLIAGDTLSWGSGSPITAIYRNVGGTFQRTADQFLGLTDAKVAWGDFDGDGDLDFAVSGTNPLSHLVTGMRGDPTTLIYRFVSGRFQESARPDMQIGGDLAWVDFDNDGDLDLIGSGTYIYQNVTYSLTLLFRNDGTKWTTLWPDNAFILGGVAVADFDGDGDQDFAVSGYRLKVFRNSLIVPNAAPSAPGGLSSALGRNSVHLSWGASNDAETTPDGMQYNLRVGTSPGGADVLSPLSALTGFRLTPSPGNAGQIRTATLNGLAPGTYYWSAQGFDQQLAGSPFPSEQSFSLGLPAPELLGAESGPGPGAVTLRWHKLPQTQFQRYLVHYGTSAAPEARMDSVIHAGDTVLIVKELTDGTTYHFRLSAEDAGGNPSSYSNELTATPDGTPPAIPAPFTASPGDRSVTLNWPAATESDFLCYLIYQRNASGPVARIDSITDIHATGKVVSGLKNGTPYAFLIVASDRVGNHSGFSPEAVAIPAYLLTPAVPAIAFGKIHLGAAQEATLKITNGSGLRVPVDSARVVNDAFLLPALPSSLPANADTTLTVRFAPGKPAGGDFTGVLKLYYGGAPLPLEIDLSGTAAAPPWCRIDKVTPADLPWDTASSISLLATANDSDNAGEGDRITAYLWSSNLAGPIGASASGFTLKPSALGIGAHDITLRVVDNEGDTSAAAHATVSVRSRKPLVRIDSISPRGLILRGADRPRFHCTAYDLDEGADPIHDSLHTFALYSTLQGRISGAKDTTLDSSALALGLHGFYAMAVDDEGDTSWSDTSWVPVQAGVGLALIAAGTDFNDNLYFYQNIAPACNWAYAKLRQRGFTDSLITYFNPVGWQSIGLDYHANSNIVDETRMTPALLRDRILGYRDRVRNGVPLLITLIGHGGHAEVQNGKFFLSPTEFVTPDSLDAWLDTYDSGKGDSLRTPIVLVLDFCYAGTFIPKLRSATQNRIVITSAAADRQAYFQLGQSFSYAFFKQIAKGGNLAQAWAAGKVWSDANAISGRVLANPQANADLDDTPNETVDLARLSEVYVGGSQQNQSPEADWKEVRTRLDPDTRTLSIVAVPEGPIPVDTAWYTVLKPDFDPKAAADPFQYAPLVRAKDGSFSAEVKLDNVLFGDYLVLVYGLAGGVDMMPMTQRASSSGPVALLRGLPDRFELGQNYPNPAVGQTWVPFGLTRRGPITLTLWDMRGAEVRTLATGTFNPGRYLLKWDGRDGHGRAVPPGIYLYRLSGPEGVQRKKLVWR